MALPSGQWAMFNSLGNVDNDMSNGTVQWPGKAFNEQQEANFLHNSNSNTIVKIFVQTAVCAFWISNKWFVFCEV